MFSQRKAWTPDSYFYCDNKTLWVVQWTVNGHCLEWGRLRRLTSRHLALLPTLSSITIVNGKGVVGCSCKSTIFYIGNPLKNILVSVPALHFPQHFYKISIQLNIKIRDTLNMSSPSPEPTSKDPIHTQRVLLTMEAFLQASCCPEYTKNA